ncbi:oxygen-independent coproporphyrinogen III oxidase [Stakelama sediminis]|uniref:Coproporphyrinogen-III oxidase n=1 Tax=Stakelama sediminis TaxID=463200 RepID=A0A840Z1M0_9SPHN|nr:oxygen-independent coproporphyrinogen III oxidase [Stakelama sediminis]MBB5719634.1 oxygen-independent coproporphyrinogen-3 oxidase [Stakelama sediminis]
MTRYYPELLSTPVPRYTSFPTAAEFHNHVGQGDMADALSRIGNDTPVSLYLHLPFCRQICWYCGCNTAAANRVARLSAYLVNLGREIDLFATQLAGRGRISRIAFGGGSPNAIAPEQFDHLLRHVRGVFDATDAEISVELDPRGFDHRWAQVIARNRVRRASLGVQTFAPHVQAAIGRVQPLESVACVVGQLRAAGVTSLNFDMMYGLPHQNDADLEESLKLAIDLSPDRFAVFGYAHVPHLLPRQRRIDAAALPDVEQRFAMAAHAHSLLEQAGYRPIGFDHFARPEDALSQAAQDGSMRRNFQGYTDDDAEILIGMGASAISSFPGYLLQNEKNSGRYQLRVGAGQFATARGIRRSAQDQWRGAAIEQLLCSGKADLSPLGEVALIRERLIPFAERGLIGWAGNTMILGHEAWPYARGIAAALDPYRQQSTTRFSNAV